MGSTGDLVAEIASRGSISPLNGGKNITANENNYALAA